MSPADHSCYLTRVTSRLINFNDDFAAQPARQFDALLLDIELQQQSTWKIGNGTVRRAFLNDLLNTYVSWTPGVIALGIGGWLWGGFPFTPQ